jgi:hypothetical protein
LLFLAYKNKTHQMATSNILLNTFLNTAQLEHFQIFDPLFATTGANVVQQSQLPPLPSPFQLFNEQHWNVIFSTFKPLLVVYAGPIDKTLLCWLAKHAPAFALFQPITMLCEPFFQDLLEVRSLSFLAMASNTCWCLWGGPKCMGVARCKIAELPAPQIAPKKRLVGSLPSSLK